MLITILRTLTGVELVKHLVKIKQWNYQLAAVTQVKPDVHHIRTGDAKIQIHLNKLQYNSTEIYSILITLNYLTQTIQVSTKYTA